MDSNIQNYRTIHFLGIILFPSFFFLDLIIYPQDKWALLTIRSVLTLYSLIAFFAIDKMNAANAKRMMHCSLILAPATISYMCFLTGDGSRSPYYAGLFLIMLAFPYFMNLGFRALVIHLLLILGIHFSFLFASYADFHGIMINLFFLCSFALMAVLLHGRNQKFVREIKTLQGFLPICMHCKKIRNDKGYWDKIEKYISARTDVSFSHGICPECLETHYPEELNGG